MIEWVKWEVADLLNWYYGGSVCWPMLAVWVKFRSWKDLLIYQEPFHQIKSCKVERANFGDGTCYCGKLNGIIPIISPKFFITGR